jgi:hypothetical protein
MMDRVTIRRKDGAEVHGSGVCRGDVVESRRGRDAGRRMLVLAVRDEPLAPGRKSTVYLELADGRVRRVEKPKRKKAKHVLLLMSAPVRDDGPESPEAALAGEADLAAETALACLSKTAEKLRGGETVTNSEVRRALNAYADVYGSDVRRDANVER